MGSWRMDMRGAPVYFSIVPSPLGPLLLSGDGDGLTGLHVAEEASTADHHRAAGLIEDAGPFAEVGEQLEAYFAGDRRTFDVPLAPRGTPFQHEVWSALRDVPYGETITYGELAHRSGRLRAFRAVGVANGRNPISSSCPATGSSAATAPPGYGWGIERKRWLLDLEAGLRPTGPPDGTRRPA